MTVWAHFSQRPTCPPSAAVRQRSIALMTFIWPRLTWPALARRHAAPWSRKISATSSAGRDTALLRRRLVLPVRLGLLGLSGLLARLRQQPQGPRPAQSRLWLRVARRRGGPAQGQAYRQRAEDHSYRAVEGPQGPQRHAVVGDAR